MSNIKNYVLPLEDLTSDVIAETSRLTPRLTGPKRKSMSQDPVLRVAIDDGFARIKLIGETPDGKVGSLSFPSSIRSGSSSSVSSIHGNGQKVGFYQTEEGQSFTVSADVAGEGTRFENFHISQINRVLVHHALVEGGYSGRKVMLVTSLPVNEYYKNGERDAGRIAAKQANLLKAISTVPDTKQMANVVDVKVGCQALAAYFDLTLADDGSDLLTGLESMAVVDIGGSTTDIAVILEGGSLDDNRLGSSKIGVLDVHAAIANRLAKDFGTGEQNYPAKFMDQAIRFGKVRLSGVEHDVTNLVKSAVAEVGEKLLRDINLRLGNATLLDKVFFVGGGAAVFKDVAKHWSNAEVADNPGFANARGLLKYARAFA